MDDISIRALDTLKAADVIACEDTRHSGKLLKHFGIKKRLLSYHDHNEHTRTDELIDLLKNGKSVAVISDAGTPGISDPSYRVVQKANENEITVIPIPGAVAFVNAAIASGLPTDSIFFGGFLPSKKGERIKRLTEIATIKATLCFYESPHRIAKSLEDCVNVLGNRDASIARELTKLHEEIIRGTLIELKERLSEEKIKGEIVLVVDRKRIENTSSKTSITILDRIDQLEKEGLNHKSALKQIAKEMGVSKSEAYRMLQIEKAQ